MIELDVDARCIRMDVSDEELARRRAAWTAPVRAYGRGWTQLYQQHVTQANEGCDLDFLQSGPATPEPVIY